MTKAIRVTEIGGPEVLRVGEIDLPAPGSGQATVKVTAAGVNFIDIYRRSGVYPVPLPHIPGTEGAGVIDAVGEGVTDVAVGDRVAWSDVAGSYAGAVTAQADRLVPVPADVNDQQAAALPLQGMTAHYLAGDSYRIRPGDSVLIHAGAGGVGLLLTQIAKIRGARVITTVSTAAKAQLSEQAGADDVLIGYDDIPHRIRELTGGAGVQAVYDGVGKDTFDESLDSLARRGFLVLFGGSSGQVPPVDPQRLNRGGSLSLTRPTLADFVTTRAELLARAAELFEWVGQGRLTVHIGGTYPLPDAGRAHEDLAGRRTTGKLLLLP
ncbi:MAG: quinone oxidoreductase family protein [Nakamurella sp.]